jgi:hypothetical protein
MMEDDEVSTQGSLTKQQLRLLSLSLQLLRCSSTLPSSPWSG